MVYTALTRAREACWLVGDIEAMRIGATTKPVLRYDNLARRITDLKAREA